MDKYYIKDGVILKNSILTRHSTRNYQRQDINYDDLCSIKNYLDDHNNLIGPFNKRIKFMLIEATGSLEKGRIGTYGVIKNAPMYLISICANDNHHILDCGYVFEKLILFLEERNIGTCWLGGTFSRKNLGLDQNLGTNEIIPAISPLGYKSKKSTLTSKIIERSAKSNTRKDFDDLFFNNTFDNLITNKEVRKRLEFVRIGPSASNKQPWRILMIDDIAHFYIERTPKYIGNKFGYDMQLLDIGIALAHYEVALGRTLDLFNAKPDIQPPNNIYEYIVSVK